MIFGSHASPVMVQLASGGATFADTGARKAVISVSTK
jgi:hypothetical protein